MAQIDIESLTFTHPGAESAALKNVSLSIEAGSFTCICGRSGCGKTTLLRHLKGALTPHGSRTGQVLIDGVPLTEIPVREQSQRIGFVLQRPDEQIVTDKPWHELAFGLENLGVEPNTIRLRIAEMSSFFGMQGWLHESVHNLSGGQRQLLNLAAVMALEPDILVLDEPLSQLDPIAASTFADALRKVKEDLGTTVIVAEHNLDSMLAAADELIVMESGRVVACGGPRKAASELFRKGAESARLLPTAARIFCRVAKAACAGAGEGAPSEAEAADAPETTPESPLKSEGIPLSVREGRAWLQGYVAKRAHCGNPEQQAGDAQRRQNAIPSQESPTLQLRGVWFRYERDGADVLQGLSLTAKHGDILAIVGGNGTGKSTLLKTACGIAKPYRGSVSILGKAMRKWNRKELFADGIALLPQEPSNLFSKDTVRDELLEMDTDEGDVMAIAQACGIPELLDHHPLDLSGGEVQRAALAKVLLLKPRVLLLDEPTKGLDSMAKDAFGELLGELAGNGATIVMASHDIEFCANYATRTALIFDGAIITAGTPREVFSKNAFYTTAASRMSRGVLDGCVTEDEVVGLCLH